MHANEGKCKECGLFITAMIGPEIAAKSTSGTGTAFHLGLIQAKVTWKINIPSKETYVNKTPPPPSPQSGIIFQLTQVCLHVQVRPLKL